MSDVEIEDPQPIPGLNGETVRFRAWATYADEWELMEGGRALRDSGADERTQLAYLPTERTRLMIAEWSLRNGSSEPLPVNGDTLMRLPRRAANWLIDEAEKRYEGRTGDQEGPFDTPSRPPSTDTT